MKLGVHTFYKVRLSKQNDTGIKIDMQINGIELYIYGQLIFNKGAKTI